MLLTKNNLLNLAEIPPKPHWGPEHFTGAVPAEVCC